MTKIFKNHDQFDIMKTTAAFLIFTVCFLIEGISGQRDSSCSDSDCSDDGSDDYNDENSDLNNNYSRTLSTPEECARTCVRGEKPKTCYYHFRAETYGTLTRACTLCQPNSTTRLTGNCECIPADGYELSGIKVVNRMYPGPSILVCLNDYVVIDVENHVHGNGITIHWHGIFQDGYQYYDGVPYVTQCPIEEGTSFRYQWRAKNSGTHFWHSHSGLQKSDGLQGAIVVREPKEDEINSEYWDNDDIDNVIFISDWFHNLAEAHFPGNYHRLVRQIPDNFLINGMGQWTDNTTGVTTKTALATINVNQGQRYRFRMINGLSLTCPISLTIEGHNMTVIATDGEPIVPVVVDSLTSFAAERYDFVINTVNKPASYWIQVQGLGECFLFNRSQVGIFHYNNALTSTPLSRRPNTTQPLPEGQMLNKYNTPCNGSPRAANNICVSQLRSAQSVPARITKRKPDFRFYFPVGFYQYAIGDVFKPRTFQSYIVPTLDGELISIVGKNATYASPPVPLITQRDEIAEEQFCTINRVPARCAGQHVCPCTMIEEIPLNSVVEVVVLITDDTVELNHPFHLHGGFFYVLGEGVAEDFNLTGFTVENVKALDRKNLLKRNFNSPAPKDTHEIFNKGYAVIRFLAANPGYWFYHCHFEFHLATGMAMVFHVGNDDDLPPTPEGFPVCGNYLPPIADK